jgi:transcriptional regulator with XRE-family HTH domain
VYFNTKYTQRRFVTRRFIFMAVHLGIPSAATMTISTEERTFFIAMGERIASLRKAHNVTQVQLAEALGISQQTLQSYEVGRRRIPVSALPTVAHTLSVSLDELFGEDAPGGRSRGKRGPASRLHQQIDAVAQLPKAKQLFVSQMIDTVLAQQGR